MTTASSILPLHECKYVRREGESCTLNNNCRYPNCPPPMTKEQLEIKKLKKLAENEIVQWLSVLSELERLDHYANTTKKIEKAFKKAK